VCMYVCVCGVGICVVCVCVCMCMFVCACVCGECGWKRISRHRILQEGVSLLRTKSRDNVGILKAGG